MLPKAILVDLDGTLALFEGRRNPYDASRCDETDDPNPAILYLLKIIDCHNRDICNMADSSQAGVYGRFMDRNGVKIILMSGRDSKYRPPTERWLSKHRIPYSLLYMRKEGDVRKDSIIKRELYEEHIANKYEVLFVLDDRNQVVDLWRKGLGLHCFQVNYGDF